ncbi:MAG: glycosyltransferase family 1 protein [Patescibacteria group bacterium]|nr:glycosyltransferase family 1 protein [Patescibacteria group bacterium]
MKIGIDVTGIHENQKTGTETFISNFIKELGKDNKNTYILYSYFDVHKKIILPSNFKLKICKFKPPLLQAILMFIFWNSISLPFYIMKDKLDLFISTNQMGPLFCKSKFMIVIHDLSFVKTKKCFTRRDQIIYNFFAKLSLNRAISIFADSIATKKDIKDIYHISDDKIKVVYLGFDNKTFCLQNKSVMNSVKIKYNIKNKYIIFVGTLQKRKNIRRLIEAYNILKKSGKIDYDLAICGKKGWLYEDIFLYVKENSLEDNVIFLGFVPDDDIAPLIAGAEMFVLPSLYEGFGLPLLESMAVGTPTITSNISSLPEVVGSAGLLVNDPTSVQEIAEKILLLSTDNCLKKDLKLKGLNRSKHFTWEIAGVKYRNIINSLFHEN